MHSALRLGYEGSARLARLGASLANLFPSSDKKALRALRARSGIIDRYRAWAAPHRDLSRPLLWMHAPSVGEGLQARPILELMRQRHPEVQLAYTHFSPSAESLARSLDVDFRDYLPFDSAADVRAALDALQPTALVYAKLDVWPTLTAMAHARGIHLGLVSATLAQSSSRRSRFATALLHDAYAALDAVGAIDEADAGRLVALGVKRNTIALTGDTRYDQVWQRAQRVDRQSPMLSRLASNRPTLVAGSTWPADERVLLPVIAEAHRRFATTRLVIAPHEPTTAHLAPIETWAATAGLRLDRLDAASASSDVVLVDRVGVLGDLYALADFAFVGGGFHDEGLHSVLEPAAFGAPVLFGPRHGGSRDALLLVRDGGGRAVRDVASLGQAITLWIENSPARLAAGNAARALVSNGLGAAERSLRVVESLLDRASET
ncbi:MAG TPA: glycosyltransferase N-terminal domain-containing protein [Gemmatimonadaceae bacterium]|nr:glycosyltransferase N-terminal domain-containing protein [Gemmatimonadaceae bacterium]